MSNFGHLLYDICGFLSNQYCVTHYEIRDYPVLAGGRLNLGLCLTKQTKKNMLDNERKCLCTCFLAVMEKCCWFLERELIWRVENQSFGGKKGVRGMNIEKTWGNFTQLPFKPIEYWGEIVFSGLCFDLHKGRTEVKAFHKLFGVLGLGEIRSPNA